MCFYQHRIRNLDKILYPFTIRDLDRGVDWKTQHKANWKIGLLFTARMGFFVAAVCQ